MTQQEGRLVESAAHSRHPQILPLGCDLPGRVCGVKDFRQRLKYLTPHALPGTLAGSGVFEGERKGVRVASKMENLELTGVRKRHFGVTEEKTDSGVASQKKWRNFTGVNFICFGVMKKSTGVRNNRIGVMKKQTGVKFA